MEEWYQTDDFFICVREQDQAEDDVPVYFAFPKHPEEFWPQNTDLERKVAVADGAPTGGGRGETKGSSPFGAAGVYSPGGGAGMGGGGQYSPQQQQQQQQQYSPQQHPSQPDVDALEESYTATCTTEGRGDLEEKTVSEMMGAERVAVEKARRKKKKQEAAAATASKLVATRREGGGGGHGAALNPTTLNSKENCFVHPTEGVRVPVLDPIGDVEDRSGHGGARSGISVRVRQVRGRRFLRNMAQRWNDFETRHTSAEAWPRDLLPVH